MSQTNLDIIWDETKAQLNIAKHGIGFATAATVLLDPLALTVFDTSHSDHEERWFTLGIASDGKLLAISHTYQSTNQKRAQVRIISAREATRRERNQYENNFR